MTERIECVGGPADKRSVPKGAYKVKLRYVMRLDFRFNLMYSDDVPADRPVVHYIYRYDVTQSKYIYQGVEQ